MVGGAGVLFFFGADQSSVLHTGHVVLCGSVQIAVGQQLLIELDHLAGFHSLRLQGVDLFLRTVDPNDLRGLGQFHFFVQHASRDLLEVKVVSITLFSFKLFAKNPKNQCIFCYYHYTKSGKKFNRYGF